MSSISRLTFIFIVMMLTSMGVKARAAQELVTLTMTERAGVNRKAEWITIGVPLPKGQVRSTDELCVLQKGRAIPAEILPDNKWWDNGSLRWIHLIFQSHCPANGKTSIVLAQGNKALSLKQKVEVTEGKDRFLVDTGAIAFEVRKKGFNIIDIARIRDEQVIETHERGLCVTVEGEEYCAALDPNTTVILEEKGPLHAVLRATGSLRNLRHDKKFDYDCRLYAYAGSPEVRLLVSLINRQDKDTDFIPLSSFRLELPTTITTGNCLFGAENGGTKTGDLSKDPEAYIYQMSSNAGIF